MPFLLLGVMILGTPSWAATVELFSHDEGGNLMIQSGELALKSGFPIRQNPETFADGQTHVALGVPIVSLDPNNLAFGPILADVDIALPDSGGGNISIFSATPDRAAPVPMVDPGSLVSLQSHLSSAGGGGGISQVTVASQPSDFVLVTLEGSVGTSESMTLTPVPLPGALWVYVTGIILWSVFKRWLSCLSFHPSSFGFPNFAMIVSKRLAYKPCPYILKYVWKRT